MGDEAKSPAVGQTHHQNPVHIWAAGIKTPLRYQDRDARLKDGDRHADQTYGQAGWHVSMEFTNFANLADQLAGGKFDLPSFVCGNAFFDCGPIEEIQIARLGILAHGGPGAIDMDGVAGRDLDTAVAQDPTLLNVKTLSRYKADFARIEKMLAPRAKVFFVSCLAGAGTDGEDLFNEISLLWDKKEIQVFGYRSVLYQDVKQKKKGDISCFPGARETHYDNLKPQGTPIVRYYETLAAWNDLKVLPWASERSPHAIGTFKGVVLKKGAPGIFDGSPPAP